MKYFLIGIGGTGMRCLEAFIHLCAVGLLDNKEFHILSIDTDHQNGNKDQTDTLIDKYVQIRTEKEEQLDPKAESFFTAKVHFYQFSTEHSQRSGMTSLSDKAGIRMGSTEKEIADLLFDDDVQRLDLAHGYRAQTHLGSFLMYHELIDEVKKHKNDSLLSQRNQLIGFLRKMQGEEGKDAKIFIMGSIFGGTGASSIPVIPRFIRDAMNILDSSLPLNPSVAFGATLLTSYFNFEVNEEQKRDERVIADSKFFALNSQAALTFYHDDASIEQGYKTMYHIGWPSNPIDVQDKDSPKTITGGAAQKNPGHVIEFLCAFAASNFFEHSANNIHTKYFRTVKDKGQNHLVFDARDFDNALGDMLTDKMGAFLGFALMLNSHTFKGDIVSLLSQMNQSLEKYYNTINPSDLKSLEDYLKRFAYHQNGSTIVDGWLRELKKSLSYDDFLFNAACYDHNKIQKFNWGAIFKEEGKNFKLKKKLFGKQDYSDAWDHFKIKFLDIFKKERKNLDAITNHQERLIKHIYLTFKAAFTFTNTI